MNIPKSVIEKAIAGGWKGDLRYKTQYPEIKEGSGDVLIWYVDTVNKEWTFDRLSFQQIALDPTFWQSLGKALGWGKTNMCWGCNYDEGATENTDVWFVKAHRFYDLVLQDQDTTDFWQKLLDKTTV